MNVLHVKDVANVGKSLVSGLRQINIDAELYETINIDKTRLPKPIKKLIGLAIAIFELCRFFLYTRIKKFSIVHIHYGTVAYLALLTGTRFYLHLHGTDVRESINKPIAGWFVRQGIKRAVKVFYTTPDLEEIIIPLRCDAIFFPNPINMEWIQANHTDLDQPKIADVFSVSKIDRYKGIEKIFDTIKSLTVEFPNIRINVFGFGNATQDVLTTLKIFIVSPQINVLEKVTHEKMIILINNTKIILGQLSIGSLGCSELEAMACGKPVVCRFNYAEMYPSPPPIISVETAVEAKEKIIELLNAPEKAEAIGRQAQQWVEDYYDIKPVAKSLLKIYERNS